MRKLVLLGALMAMVVLVSASTTLGAGSFPAAGFTWIADQGSVNSVNMIGDVRLKTKSSVTVKTTYSKIPDTSWSTFDAGWHYHNGPVIVSVTVGTLTFFNPTCGSLPVHAGEAYIESTGQVLNARIQAAEQSGNTTVEWFTTRLYPLGAIDPVPVTAPCTIP